MKPSILISLAALACLTAVARADVVTDWNIVADDIVDASPLTTPEANRVFAIVNTASFRAANAITHRYGGNPGAHPASEAASVDAAIAAAHHLTLSGLAPMQKAALEAAYASALAKIPDGAAKVAGLKIGEREAAATLALRANDGANAAETY